MKLNLLSRYRTQLMGVAILWVMFFHSHLPTEFSGILDFFKKMGYGGVDIFILVSGFGVYYSISKDGSTKNFYFRRAIRILPYYLPIVLIVTIIANIAGFWKPIAFFYNLTTLGFWLNVGLMNIYDWFIPALISIYLFTPLFYKFFKINKTISTLVVILGAYIFSYLSVGTFDYLYNFTFRIPLYVMGFWLADYLKNHKDYKLSKNMISLITVIFIFGILLLCYLYYFTSVFSIYGNYLLPFIFITLPLCVYLCYIFSLFPNYKFPILTFLGSHSLTLFIFHEKILFYCSLFIKTILSDIIAFIVTVILAYYWQKFVDRIIERYMLKKNKQTI
ncbi:acyltransferase [Apibacter muscae]|uniref:acyltransferase family protein n=1 Tax=Apibacter muscae TaxID=2509004 RepID=UPI0011AD1EFB|nr:acyltransferase [Apibacter muscae]TWP31004.1 acyltransferase [Apibacter muscae]